MSDPSRFSLRHLLDSKLTRDVGVVLAVRGVGAVAAFGLAIVLGRSLGTTGVGVYYLAFSVATTAAVLGRVGLDGAMMRAVATAASDADWSSVRGIYRQGMRVGASLSLVLSLVVVLVAPTLASRVFSDPELTSSLRVAALMIPALALLQIHAQVLKAIGRPLVATFLQTIGPPASAVLMLWLGSIDDPRDAVLAVVAAYWGFLIVSIAVWVRAVGSSQRGDQLADLRALVRVSLPLLVTASMYLIIGQTDTLMLGIFGEASEVGTYTSALRFAFVIRLILVALESIVPPRYAVHQKRGEVVELEELARRTSWLGTVAAFLPVVVMLVAAGPLMGIFGEGFETASTALRILVIGQFINVGVGPVGFLLVMTGNERLLQRTMVSAAVANIVLNATLIPLMGTAGAALATAVTLGGLSLANVYWVRTQVGINPLPIGKRMTVGSTT